MILPEIPQRRRPWFSLPRDGERVLAGVADGGRDELAYAILPLNSDGALELLDAILTLDSECAELLTRLRLLETKGLSYSVGALFDCRDTLVEAIFPLSSEGAALEAARLWLLEAMLPANSVGAILDARLLLARLP